MLNFTQLHKPHYHTQILIRIEMNNSFPFFNRIITFKRVIFSTKPAIFFSAGIFNLLLISDNQLNSLEAYRLNRIKQRAVGTR